MARNCLEEYDCSSSARAVSSESIVDQRLALWEEP